MNRPRIPLDGTWDFFPDPARTLSVDLLDGATARQIHVPAPWQAQFDDLRQQSGVAWYRTAFTLPESFRDAVRGGKSLILHFGAVDYFASVWLNRTWTGDHEGGYLPFELPLERDLALDGSNELIVRVIDPGDNPDAFPEFTFSEIPHGKQSWYGPISGIWQSVWMEARNETHIALLHATPDVGKQNALFSVRLSQPPKRGKQLKLEVLSPRNGLHTALCPIEAGQQTVECTVGLPDPVLWDTQNPALYQARADLGLPGGEGEPLDSLEIKFGVRQISTSPDGHLMLNGRILFLRGALDQDYYPDTIYTPFSDAELDDQFAKAKHMGLNCLRTHIKITDPRYYEAADRAGLLIWAELPNWQELTEAAKKRAVKTLAGMVERDWNHPSIVIWTIVNEGWGLDLAGNPEHRKWLSDTFAFLKRLDPHRLVVGNSPCFANFHVVTDIEDYHNYYAIPDHFRQWRDWVATFAGRPSWTFAHPYGGIESWRSFIRDPWSPTPRTPAPEVRRSGHEPMVVSEFGNWGLPDLDLLRGCHGGKDPWWFETGIEWGNGVVYPHGLEQRFQNYHLNRVFPTLSDLSAASQRMQFTALKYEIEQIRLRPSIVGYIITEFTDVHWEANGLLDMCRNPKGYFDVIGMVNSADAIVPEWDRIAFWEGERCEVRVSLSHYSASALGTCRLKWFLDLDHGIAGEFDGLTPQPARLLPIGTIAFTVPALRESARARLELRLLGEDGSEITRNHQELYIISRRNPVARPKVHGWQLPDLADALRPLNYPWSDSVAEADVVVAATMDDSLREHVQTGGKVLWLPDTVQSQQTYLGTVGLAARQGSSWQGDWASSMSWIRQDRMFASIPSSGTVDFAFADLTPELVILGLRPFEFESDVHAGLFVGWLHQAVPLVVFRRLGSGYLLICTFRLRSQMPGNPVAASMIEDMIGYLHAKS